MFFGSSSTLFVLDIVRGRVAWQVPVPQLLDLKADRDHIYVAAGWNHLVVRAFAWKGPDPLWSRTLERAAPSRSFHQQTLAVGESAIVVYDGQEALCLTPATGAPNWHTPISGALLGISNDVLFLTPSTDGRTVTRIGLRSGAVVAPARLTTDENTAYSAEMRQLPAEKLYVFSEIRISPGSERKSLRVTDGGFKEIWTVDQEFTHGPYGGPGNLQVSGGLVMYTDYDPISSWRGRAVVAADVRTGDVRWRRLTPDSASVWNAGMWEGVDVLLRHPRYGGRVVLDGLSLKNGRPRWSVPLPGVRVPPYFEWEAVVQVLPCGSRLLVAQPAIGNGPARILAYERKR